MLQFNHGFVCLSFNDMQIYYVAERNFSDLDVKEKKKKNQIVPVSCERD